MTLAVPNNGSEATNPSASKWDTISHWQRRPDPRPTLVFDAYWQFAAERQAIFFRRHEGAPPPWTDDDVLRDFKFTNAYRASDRTSQYLIRRVIYEGPQSASETFFRTILFKLFNRIETWEALQSAIGPLSAAGFDPDAYRRALTLLQARGQQLYSAAYIIPPVSSLASGAKHVGHIELIAKMLREDLADRTKSAVSLCDVY
ncbi:MAG TPA: nucleotide kinase domain-containing protein, partial [Acidimicrobiales bacterium]|nr:nucleotide kinase domain-containing protein [Acidimicrobiales bacterium]